MSESVGSYLCPYCLNLHSTDQFECPTEALAIPKAYIRAQQEGVRTASMLTIGYRGHGKTCYLASFMHSLYYGDPVDLWPGFSFIGLNQTTLDLVHTAYVNPLRMGVLPPRSNSFIRDCLILEMHDVPLARRAGPIVRGYAPQRLVLNLYDIGGEVYKAQETIQQNLPLISGLENLVLLIDLGTARADAEVTGAGPAQQMHNLLNTVLNAIDELDQRGQKGIVVTFTKADRLWGDVDYGPLAQPASVRPQGADGMRAYVGETRRRSQAIGEWVRAEYPQFFNLLKAYFKPLAFTTVSALGTTPQGGDDGKTVNVLRPSGLFDPLLSLLIMDGFL